VSDAALLVARAEALLVDLDGTLVDSTAPVRRAWSAFARRHGIDPEEMVRLAQGQPSRETVARHAPPEAHAREAAAMEEAETTDTDGIQALPGAEDLLRSERRLAIVTSCTVALATVRLDAAGLRPPGLMITADDVENGKPHPEPFLRGAWLVGVEPARCVVLEDSPAGIAAARAAGIPVVAVRTTHAERELAEADALARDVAALLG
jgi:sugar-phosphatase